MNDSLCPECEQTMRTSIDERLRVRRKEGELVDIRARHCDACDHHEFESAAVSSWDSPPTYPPGREMNRRTLLKVAGSAIAIACSRSVFQADNPVYFVIRTPSRGCAGRVKALAYVLRPGHTIHAPGGHCTILHADGTLETFWKTVVDAVWVGITETTTRRVHACQWQWGGHYVTHQCDDDCYVTSEFTKEIGEPWLVMPTISADYWKNP